MAASAVRMLLACGGALLVLAARPAPADTVVTRGGARFEGEVAEDGDAYVITSPSGGRMRLAKDVVLEVIRGQAAPPADAPAAPTPAPESPPSEAPAAGAAAVPASPAADADATLYMEVPIVGAIGDDVVPEGVEHCLRWASQNARLKHVVFRIKSPGGCVAAADAIQGHLRQYADRFQYHALIEEALSAAIWVVLACDTVHMKPGATVGGAVTYTVTSTGQADVDAKVTSIIAAQLASLASSKKHSPVLARAMVVRAEQAYAWLGDDGAVRIEPLMPQGVPVDRVVLRDGPATVVTLTRDQAVRLGFARPADGDSSGLGAALGLPGWRPVSDYAEKAMARLKAVREREAAARQKAVEQNNERRRAALAYITQVTDEAIRNDPERFTYAYDMGSGQFTPTSAALWKKQTDLAIAAWRRVQGAVKAMVDLEKEAERLGLPRVSHDVNLAQTYDRASREIARLAGNRGRTRL